MDSASTTAPSTSPEEKDVDEKETLNEDDDERMWAAVSFAIILLLLGVPLWWKMTEVERSYFPYEDIADLGYQNLTFHIKLDIHICKSSDSLGHTLRSSFAKSSLYEVDVRIVQSKFCKKEVEEMEKMVELVGQTSTDIKLFEMEALKPQTIMMGRHRAAYFGSNTEPQTIHQFLEEVLLHEEMLLESVKSIISPGLMSNNIDLLRKVRPSPKYDIVFTVVNPEPDKIKFIWDNKEIIDTYFQPVIRNLSRLSEFRIKSQWLYLIDLGQTPKKVGDHFEMIQIPHIITPLEKKIGSGVAQNPCINFVLYITQCAYAPTFFVDHSGKPSTAILSARWGGVQLVNPNGTNCAENLPLQPDVRSIMRIFLFQFRTLLGLTDSTSAYKVLLGDDTVVSPWEIDILYRMRVLELFTSSRITLTSLSQLLGEINNIVITDKVGEAVVNAVMAARSTLNSLKEGDLIGALNSSTETFLASEFAFTHPSLLALLYFPDDQKYAVYIPLYLPVMIPVLFSLKNIGVWLKAKLGLSVWFSRLVGKKVENKESSTKND